MNKLYWFLAGLIVAVISLYFAIISPKDNEDVKKVATSIFAVHSLTQQIAEGGDIDVVNILPAGVSPHQYQPTAQDQLRLSSVDKVFIIGHELDNWAENIAKSINESVKLITMDKGIALMEFGEEEYSDDDDHDEHEHDDENGGTHEHEDHEHGDYDPHYWFSVKNAKVIAQTIKDELVDLDKDNKAIYEQNFNALIASLDELIADNAQIAKRFQIKEVVTFHNAFGYLAKELGLEVVATVSEFPGQTPSPSYIANVGNLIKKHNIKILFKEPELSEEIVATLAGDYGAKVETLDPLEGGRQGATYQSIMAQNMQTLANALGQN